MAAGWADAADLCAWQRVSTQLTSGSPHCSALPSRPQMPLLSDCIGLPAQREKGVVDVLGGVDAELVEDVPRREHFDAPEQLMLGLAGEDEVTVEPVLSGLERREAHSDVEGDA